MAIGRKNEFQRKIKTMAEEYFNNQPFKCKSVESCCPICKDGVKIEFQIQFSEGVDAIPISCPYTKYLSNHVTMVLENGRPVGILNAEFVLLFLRRMITELQCYKSRFCMK